MPTQIKITQLRYLPGCSAGLRERTALVDLAFNAPIDNLAAAVACFAGYTQHLCPSEPLWGCDNTGWPMAFVQDGGQHPGADWANWVVALTVALQRWARDPVWRGRVLQVTATTMRLALPYARTETFKPALVFAIRHLLEWSQPTFPEPTQAQLHRDLNDWLGKVQAGGLAPNTLRFYAAAMQRGIPAESRVGVLHLGWGVRSQRLDSSFTGHTSNIAARLAKNKHQTSQLLRSAGLPVPLSFVVSNQQQAMAATQKLGWPVVVKPINQDQGLAVVPGIRNETELCLAFDTAAKYSPGAVLVEKHILGEDHRMLVVGGKHVMSTQRIPGGVTGDGQHSFDVLIAQVNADPLRGVGKRNWLISLSLNAEALSCLADQGLTPNSVPAAGRFVRLRRTANISTGGTAVDVTAQVHPDNRVLAERASRIIGLDIAGVDFLCPDISRSWREVGGGICEVNAQPGFRVHWLGDPGRDINGEVVDWLFAGQTGRIPTAAITGTNGKTTVARMLHHIWLCAGKVAGVAATSGVWVGRDLVSDQNLSGNPGGRMLLSDPAVEVAVIEMPRKGLIRLGHPCDRYDVAALLNVQNDHIGVDGINSLEQMAQLKAEVLERATHAVVINADDPLCLAMRAKAGTARHILVAREGSNAAVQAHRTQGGEAVFIQMHQSVPWVVLAQGESQTLLMPLHDIAATMKGLLRFNETNALFALALAWAQEVPLEIIRQALTCFANSAVDNPGRYNLIDGFPFTVLLDYGHNPDGVRELCGVALNLPIKGRRHLLNLKVGNRHKAHLQALAPVLAKTFDTFVLGCDANYTQQATDYVGDDPVATMLEASYTALSDQGIGADQITLERDSIKAIYTAISSAQPGDLLVLLAEPWDALPILAKVRSNYLDQQGQPKA